MRSTADLDVGQPTSKDQPDGPASTSYERFRPDHVRHTLQRHHREQIERPGGSARRRRATVERQPRRTCRRRFAFDQYAVESDGGTPLGCRRRRRLRKRSGLHTADYGECRLGMPPGRADHAASTPTVRNANVALVDESVTVAHHASSSRYPRQCRRSRRSHQGQGWARRSSGALGDERDLAVASANGIDASCGRVRWVSKFGILDQFAPLARRTYRSHRVRRLGLSGHEVDARPSRGMEVVTVEKGGRTHRIAHGRVDVSAARKTGGSPHW